MGSYARDFYAPKATQQPTIGDTKFSVVRQDHMGWMNCDGRLLSTEDYALLFRVIQYSFGGSGDQFALPDMQSRVPGAIGTGTTPNLSTRTLGQEVGTETHTLIIEEMPAHKHGSVDVTGNNNGNGSTTTNGEHIHSGTTDPAGFAASGTSAQTPITGTNVADDTGSHTHTFTTNSAGNHNHTMGSTGGDQPHNNMQPTLFIGNMFMYSGKLHSGTSKWRYQNNTNIL